MKCNGRKRRGRKARQKEKETASVNIARGVETQPEDTVSLERGKAFRRLTFAFSNDF
jgi:hypothetical protein